MFISLHFLKTHFKITRNLFFFNLHYPSPDYKGWEGICTSKYMNYQVPRIVIFLCLKGDFSKISDYPGHFLGFKSLQHMVKEVWFLICLGKALPYGKTVCVYIITFALSCASITLSSFVIWALTEKEIKHP